MDLKALIQGVEQIAEDKKIEVKKVFEAIEGALAAAYKKALRTIDGVARAIESGRIALQPSPRAKGPLKVTSNFSKPDFCKAIAEAKKYIAVGDAFQLVISQAFQAKVKSRPFDVYRALRSINPSPYMFYIHAGSFHLVGSSPETHVRCEAGVATLRPIAGTRPRGSNDSEDEALKKELLA